MGDGRARVLMQGGSRGNVLVTDPQESAATSVAELWEESPELTPMYGKVGLSNALVVGDLSGDGLVDVWFNNPTDDDTSLLLVSLADRGGSAAGMADLAVLRVDIHDDSDPSAEFSHQVGDLDGDDIPDLSLTAEQPSGRLAYAGCVLLSFKLTGGVNDFDDVSLCYQGVGGNGTHAPFIGDWDADGDANLFFEHAENDVQGVRFIPGEHLAWDDPDAWVPQ